MKIIYFIVMLTFLSTSTTTGTKLKIPNQCKECNEISTELRRINDSVVAANLHRSRKLVKKVGVLDSANKKINSELKEKTKELKQKEMDLAKINLKLQKKPKIIRDTVQKIIYVEKKKNFWGTTKTDTIKK